MRSHHVEVLADERAVAQRAAELTRDLAKEMVANRKQFTIALSGGSTPKLFHRALVAMKDQLEWEKIHVYYSDERAVPPDHEHSNHRMAKETLLEHVPIPETNVHRIQADDGDTLRAAASYEGQLLLFSEVTPDLVMLGMGADGHTASLFPGREPPDDDRLVVPASAPPESPIERRVTFSYLALERAPAVIVMVTGANKAERLAEVLGDRKVDLPLRKVLDRRRSDSILLVDEAAASRLPKEK